MLYKLPFLIFPLCILSCQETIHPYDKVATYNDLCASISRYSASIETRKIDWDSLCEVYHPIVSNDLSDEHFFELTGELLRHFRDPHVWLISPEQRMYTIDFLNYVQNFNNQVVISHYLNGIERHSSTILSGKISDNIGYLYCTDFKGDVKRNNAIYTEVIQKFRNSKGLIIDLRANDGGSVYNAQRLLNKFTPERNLWHITQNRTIDGFDEPYEWYIEPDEQGVYLQPVIVLTGRYTISAGERFAIGAKLLDHVILVGDTTANTQGSIIGREMLNGWQYTFTFEQVLSASRVNYAGIGIGPDYYIAPALTISGTKDLAIEKAIEIINQ